MPKLWISLSQIIQVFILPNLKQSQKSHYQIFGYSYTLVPNVNVKREAIQIKTPATLKNTYLKNILPRYKVKGNGEPQSQLLYLPLITFFLFLLPFIPFPCRD